MDPLITGAINLQRSATFAKIDYAVAKKLLDSQSQQGSALIQLINAASKGVNQAGDELVAAATGLGSQLDTYA